MKYKYEGRNVASLLKLGVCLIVALFCFSGTIPTDCIKRVHDIYKKMNSGNTENGYVYMNFTMNTKLSETVKTKDQFIQSDIEYIVGKNKMHYLSNDMKVYCDEKDNFTILPSRKLIVWTNSLMESGQGTRMKSYQVLQDSMFLTSRLLSCEVKSDNAKTYDKVIAIEPVNNSKKQYLYNKITFYINTSTNEIKKVVINYPPKSDYSSIEVIYNKVQYNYQSKELALTAKEWLFTSNGNLQDKYKTFKLIDERVKSKKK